MNQTEYVRGLEHRKRLFAMVDLAKKTMTENGFRAFSSGIEYQLNQLDNDLAAYERSENARFCNWMGMRSYQITGGTFPLTAIASIANSHLQSNEECDPHELALCPA